LGVNIDSDRRYHVNIGKIIIPVEDPINLAVQTEPVASAINFHAYQKAMDVGAPIRKAAAMGLSRHHSDKNWAFN
jgi:hypothetical protein